MLIACLSIGDSCVTVNEIIPLKPEHRRIYEFCHRDLITGKVDIVEFMGEGEALMAFAAWIVSDKENIGALEPYRMKLPAHICA